MNEFLAYLEQLASDVETGHLSAQDLPDRVRSDYGGTRIKAYIPLPKAPDRHEIDRLVSSGVPARKARRLVRGH
jgi:hypothetical protein